MHNALQLRDRTLTFRRAPLVMGILNVTPDSFSDGGRFARLEAAVAHARQMAADGADVIDIGGESTRPGSEGVSAVEEMDRILPVIRALVNGRPPLPVPLSVDTSKPEVAAAALAEGCSMVNDVTAGQSRGMDDALRAHPGVAVVLMHMLGEPRSMQKDPHYDNAPRDIAATLALRAAALEMAGIARERIVLDPGIGFGKTVVHNLEILHNLDELKALGYPVLVGASRKSFLGTLAGGAAADARLAGSLAVAAHCYAHGVHMVRVHDVRETTELFRTLDAIANPASAPKGRP